MERILELLYEKKQKYLYYRLYITWCIEIMRILFNPFQSYMRGPWNYKQYPILFRMTVHSTTWVGQAIFLASSIEIFIRMMKAMSVFFTIGEIQEYVYPQEWHDPLIFSNFSLRLSIVWLMVEFFEDIIIEGDYICIQAETCFIHLSFSLDFYVHN